MRWAFSPSIGRCALDASIGGDPSWPSSQEAPPDARTTKGAAGALRNRLLAPSRSSGRGLRVLFDGFGVVGLGGVSDDRDLDLLDGRRGARGRRRGRRRRHVVELLLGAEQDVEHL